MCRSSRSKGSNREVIGAANLPKTGNSAPLAAINHALFAVFFMVPAGAGITREVPIRRSEVRQ